MHQFVNLIAPSKNPYCAKKLILNRYNWRPNELKEDIVVYFSTKFNSKLYFLVSLEPVKIEMNQREPDLILFCGHEITRNENKNSKRRVKFISCMI